MHSTNTPFRLRRAFASGLTLALISSGLFLAADAAHAANTTANYVSSSDGVTTTEVEATLIDSSTTQLAPGWHFCDGVIDTSNFVIAENGANIILGDSCDWRVNTLQVASSSSLSIWSGLHNTGKLQAISPNSPGIKVYQTSSLTVNGGSVTAVASTGAAGIGQDIGNANGPITIQWRANVDASGGSAFSSYGGGAGIGGGGSNSGTALGGANITINTTGLVIAKGGAAVGAQTAGANIGSGGTNAGADGSATVPTVTIGAPTIGANGSVKMFDTKLASVPTATVKNVAFGSALTYLAQPNHGYEIDYVDYLHGDITDLGNNLYRFTPNTTTPPHVTAFFFTVEQSKLSLTASPTASQTHPGDVVLSSTFTDGGDPFAGIPVVFTVNGSAQPPVYTDSAGIATLRLTSPQPGTYNFGASFGGDELHVGVTAAPVNGYTVLAAQPDFAIAAPSANATVYGKSPVALATSGKLSGGDVSWSVPDGNGVATIDPVSGELTMLAAGTVTVTAVAPADASHAAATATRTITIAPRPVTVRPDAQTVTFGDDITLSWTATPALVDGDSLDGSLKLAGALQIGDNEVIEDTPFSNPNYAVHFEPGTLTVIANDAQQTVINQINVLPAPIETPGQADSVAIATLALELLSDEERAVIPEQLLHRLTTAQSEAGQVNHADAIAGIAASGEALPWNVRLVIRDASAQESISFSAQIPNSRKLLTLHDIHFVDTLSNDTWQPPLGFSVQISLSKVQLDGYSNIQVHHQLDSASLETLPSTLSGGIVRFDGKTFSLYGVSGVAAGALPNTGAAGMTTEIRFASLAALLAGAGAFLFVATRKRVVRK